MGLTHEDVRRILEMLEQAVHLDRIEISIGDYVLRAAKHTEGTSFAPAALVHAEPATATSAPPAPAQAAATGASPQAVPDGMIAVRAPMAGTFYRTPSPDKPPFVKVGDAVAEGGDLCLVEVMKMFNSVRAPVTGRVHAILAEHGRPVAMNDILMVIAPEGSS